MSKAKSEQRITELAWALIRAADDFHAKETELTHAEVDAAFEYAVREKHIDLQEKDPAGAYFGTCPVCHKGGLTRNVRKNSWVACDEHKICWYAGYGLFWSWAEQTPAIWKRNAEELLSYTEAEEKPWPDPERQKEHTAWKEELLNTWANLDLTTVPPEWKEELKLLGPQGDEDLPF